MIDIAILESDIFDDLPPFFDAEIYKTEDQINEFLVNKFYWCEIYRALTRYYQGQPLKNPEWPKPFEEMMMSDLDYYLALYHLVNVAWLEFQAKFNPQQLEKFKTPGDLFLTLLWMHSVARIAQCLAKNYSYPVRDYWLNQIPEMIAGKPFEFETTPLLEGSLLLIRFVLEVCARSENSATQKALKALRGTMLKLLTLHKKWLHPRKKLQGGEWIDGVWHPGEVGKRYRPNPKNL